MMIGKKGPYVAVIAGATGAVGREMIEILEERDFPLKDLVLLASENSAAERIGFRGRNVRIDALTAASFSGADFVFFCAGEGKSREFAPEAVRAGAVVIDCSGAFALEAAVPLVIPEVNPHVLKGHQGIIANPDCSSIGLVMAIRAIHAMAGIRRAVVTTFEPVSGSGKRAIDELAGQTVALLNFRDVEKTVYPHQIAFNCLPHCSPFLESGDTRDELRLAAEARRLLDDPSLQITATAVRVPVFRGCAASVNLETGSKAAANEVRAVLSDAPGVLVYDDPGKNLYPTPIDVTGKDQVYVGRIREDGSVRNGINLWFVIDNLRKGAALNAVQIAEAISRQ